MSSNWKQLVPLKKYGINEITKFANPDTQIMLKIDTNWKRGSFTVLVNQDEKDIDYNTSADLYEYFEECYVDILESGTEEFTFIDMTTGEEIEQTEEHAMLIADYYELGLVLLDEKGYVEEDPELYIEGGFELTEEPYEHWAEEND
jgi:hypothetical protein